MECPSETTSGNFCTSARYLCTNKNVAIYYSPISVNSIVHMTVKLLEESKTSSPHWTGQQAQRDLQQAAVSWPDEVIEGPQPCS